MIGSNILSFAKSILSDALESGGIAVDATVGNGYDTVFLSRSVGSCGHVFGFDIQEEAIAQTESRLEEECTAANWTLFKAGHENMLEYIPEEFHGRVGVIMFNLGFLPGSDKSVITKPETTIAAVRSSLSLLSVGGVLCIAIYAGHPGGDDEDSEVRQFCRSLDYHSYRVVQSEMINKPGHPIRVVFVFKL
ncbi:class I SAM-dependent methyltransferase [Maridesulfovibrio sp.]|uniref:class I SAM-dependent methyltransferase n=1 Tax=Maridesulfovibrio sp. TaxID=2795000 RepID=UPI002A18A783|nr:class I SAM-dependent methyltransferase [Maridesulfovibrio sp.]